ADEMRAARERARNLLSDLDESARRTAYAEPISRDWMQEAEGWRRQLENQAIGVDNLPELRRALRRCFDSVGSPWTAAWCLADSGCRVPNSGRKKKSQQKQQFGQPGSFELVCVSELIDWQRERRQSGRALPVWLKQLAFCLGYRGGLQFFCLVGDAFQLTERPVAQSFLVVIRRLIELHLYKEAAQAATALYIQELLSPDELVLPLIGQDKVGVAEEFLDSNPDAQLATLRYLDDALENGKSLVLELNDRRLPDLRPEKLLPQQLRKLLDRLTKKFGVDPADVCPARAKRLTADKVRFLLRERLINRCLSRAALSEQLDQLIDPILDDPELQREIVTSLMQHGKLDEALNYSLQEFCWTMEDLPHRLQDRYEAWRQLPGNWAEADSEDDQSAGFPGGFASASASAESPTLTLPLELESDGVVWVDSAEEFQLAVGHIQAASRLGIDAEWSSNSNSCPASSSALIQLLQIAIEEPNCRVYLFDLPSLLQVKQQDWLSLTGVLADPAVPKLGIGIGEDLRRLSQVLSAAGSPLPSAVQFNGLVDLDGLAKRLVAEHPELLHRLNRSATDECGGERGLSELCQRVLGRRLDKSERLSDWSRRPLRRSQIVYAALDALCPLLVRQALLLAATSDESRLIVESMFLPAMAESDLKTASTNNGSVLVGVDPALRGLDSRLRDQFGIEVICTPSSLSNMSKARESTVSQLISSRSSSSSRNCRRIFLAAGGYCETVQPRLANASIECYRIDSRKTAAQQLDQAIDLLSTDSSNSTGNRSNSCCEECGCTRTSTLPGRAIRLAVNNANARRQQQLDAAVKDWELKDWLADGVDVERGTLALTNQRLWLANGVACDLDASQPESAFNVCVNCGRVTIYCQ
ncbi:hypothetical protein BOX15_Mlig031560g1, partial [Macrostomum lignano]